MLVYDLVHLVAKCGRQVIDLRRGDLADRSNRPLSVVYVLKDELKQLWLYRYGGAAERAWSAWHGWAVRGAALRR